MQRLNDSAVMFMLFFNFCDDFGELQLILTTEDMYKANNVVFSF